MIDAVWQIAGTMIILIAFGDIYLSVLQGGAASLLSGRLNKAIWWVFQRVSDRLPRSKDQILSYGGPTIIPATVAMWVVLLSVGFALIFLPVMGTYIVASSGPTPTGFWTALYFSAMSLATLGAGDLIATTDFYRLLDTFGALAGFSVLTASLAYLLSVYSALIRHNSFALSLHHASEGTGNATEIVTRLGAGGDFSTSHSAMTSLASDLMAVLESHHTYVVLRYFRLAGTSYALPRVMLLTLDTASLMRSALDSEQHHSLLRSTSVAQLWGGGMQMLTELGESFLPGGLVDEHADAEDDEQAWRGHFRRAVKQFQAEGIATVQDIHAGEDTYVALRREWQPGVAAFADYLMYEWSEICPSDNPEISETRDIA